jgi:Fe-S oxidoreductase
MSAVDILGASTLAFAFSVCAFQSLRMAGQWRRGRSSGVNWLSGWLGVPSRYLVDVHDVVARRPRNARMHASLAGGVLASLVVLSVSFALPPNIWSASAVWFFCALSFVGLCLEFDRRRNVAKGLSKGAYQTLPWLFSAALLFIVGISTARLMNGPEALILALAAATCGLFGLGGLAVMAGNGPMRHIVAGVTNLALHRRPERFGRGRSTGLKAFDLERAPLGVAKVEDFTIAQLASFDACVQCGRCEVECPAYAAGLPLNPKKLVNDLAESLRGKGAVSYGGNGYPGADRLPDALPLIFADGHVSLNPDTLWSCTTCRACVEACPMMIEHVDAIIDIRRAETMQRGLVAPHARKALENLRETDTQGGQELGARFDWATDLNLKVIAPDVPAQTLLWVGESAYERRIQRTLRSLIKMLRRAGIEPVVLGSEELDCGDVARRLGDEATFQRLAKANIATLSRYRFDYIVTADPHALHVLRNEYPALGGTFTVRHHTDVLAELMEAGRLGKAARIETSVTYHDPCYLGRYNGEFDAPRKILGAISQNFIEMEKSRSRSHCCGGGGAAPLTDVQGERRIPDMRMQQVEESGAACVAVGCPGCTAMLEGVTNSNVKVIDVAELLEASLEAAQ